MSGDKARKRWHPGEAILSALELGGVPRDSSWDEARAIRAQAAIVATSHAVHR